MKFNGALFDHLQSQTFQSSVYLPSMDGENSSAQGATFQSRPAARVLSKHHYNANLWQRTISTLRSSRSKMALNETAAKRRLNAQSLNKHVSLIEQQSTFKYDENGGRVTRELWPNRLEEKRSATIEKADL